MQGPNMYQKEYGSMFYWELINPSGRWAPSSVTVVP